MENNQNVKELVKEKYSEIALQSKTTNASSCCGAGGCSTIDLEIMSENYTSLEGYFADADLGLAAEFLRNLHKLKKVIPL